MRSYNKLTYLALLWSGFFFPGFLLSQNTDENLQLRTVVIDPGHGGGDPGAIAGGVQEKGIVLDVGLILGGKIKKAYPEIKVLYTRSKDVFIPLHARAALANRNKADLFISLHANCVRESSARGTETFTLGLYKSQENLAVAKKENSVILLEDDYTANYEGFNPNETESYIMFENMQSEYQVQSIDLASGIQNKFTSIVKLTNRGVKQAGFLVLRQTTMPGVLVEMGFISNPAERKLLTSVAGKEKIAASLFAAFADYKKTVDSKSRFNITPVAGNAPVDQSTDTAGTDKETAADKLAEIPAAPPDKEEPKTVTTTVRQKQETLSETSNSVWYSVQVGAALKDIEPSEKNFKGEKGIIRLKAIPLYKYYSGRFNTPKEAFSKRSGLLIKFPDAFVVIVENGISRPFKKSDVH